MRCLFSNTIPPQCASKQTQVDSRHVVGNGDAPGGLLAPVAIAHGSGSRPSVGDRRV